RQTLAERQRLIQRAATLEHDNDDKLAGLAEAHASAAQELARMNGEPEAAAMDAARSAIWRTAIDQRLANDNGPQAITLFDQVKASSRPTIICSSTGRCRSRATNRPPTNGSPARTGATTGRCKTVLPSIRTCRLTPS